METVLVDKENIDKIVDFLRNHHVIAFPTETVFGLGVCFDCKPAWQTIYDLKQRESSKALTLMVANIEDIKQYAFVDSNSEKIIKAFMPGQLTMILKKKAIVEDYLTAGRDTIGIRIPDDAFVLQLLKVCGPMLVTSANISGYPDMTNDKEVEKVFEGKIPLIVRGIAKSGIASTVVDCSQGVVKILRLGNITLKQIEEVIQ